VPIDWLALYLAEDLAEPHLDASAAAALPRDVLLAGDVTGAAVAGGRSGQALLVTREDAFVAGLQPAAELFARLGCTARPRAREATWVAAGAPLLAVAGPMAGLLAAERTALNLLARMMGVATETRRLVERLAEAGSKARVAATRKTTPGFRAFEKAAVAAAGGEPYRMGLYDAAMLKDNHRGVGRLEEAIAAVRRHAAGRVLTVEVETLADARTAAAAGADWVMFDNQSAATGRSWAEALRAAHTRIRIEASGGIDPERILDYAWADRISLGALTTRACSIDLSLEWGPSP
jgi:nicotinate-nucleotide pyrophosphorylase (carboxylating)